MTAGIERWDPPNEATAFESLCLDLWRVIWNDPSAQRNGRRGERQDGVDLFGKSEGHWRGVQCKQRDGQLLRVVTPSELSAEVEKARRFEPALATFVLATTAPRNAKLQARARQLSDANQANGLFAVEVWAWEDIWQELCNREQLLRRIAWTYWPRRSAYLARPAIAISRLLSPTDQVIGRQKELKLLDAIADDPAKNVVTITAWGGAGKTSLVTTWMNSRRVWDSPIFDSVFDWSFYRDASNWPGATSSDPFFAAAFDFFGVASHERSMGSPWGRGETLAQLLWEHRTLLVLDGIEMLQHPPGPLAGRLTDLALCALLRGLAQRNRGLCVVTSREHVTDLEGFATTTAPEMILRRLSPGSGMRVLRQIGVQGTDDECRTLVKDVEGHALTIGLIGKYLMRAFGGDIRRRDQVSLRKADAAVQGGHAFRVIRAYETWLSRSGAAGNRAVAVLRILGLFGRPADKGSLDALRRGPPIPQLTDIWTDVDAAEWDIAVSWLDDCGLVARTAAPAPIWQDSVSVHPLVREYFAESVRVAYPASWRAGHARLYQYLRDTTEDRAAPTLQDLQPLYEAIMHGCEAGLQVDVEFPGFSAESSELTCAPVRIDRG